MQFPFVKKIPANNFTTLDLPASQKQEEKKQTIESKKLSIIFAVAFVFFLSSLGFWIYVNFLMKN